MRYLILLLFSIFSFGVFPQEGKHQIAHGIIENHVLFGNTMKEGVFCYRIPSIVTAQNGDLVAAIDERVVSCDDLRTNTDINIVVRRSMDNGKTWTEIETIVDFPVNKSASDPSMIVDRITGDIFLFYNFMDLENTKDIYFLHMIKSSDNGRTWSAPVELNS